MDPSLQASEIRSTNTTTESIRTTGDCNGSETTPSGPSQPPLEFLNGGYWYSPDVWGGSYPSEIPINTLTHIHYAFGDIAEDGIVHFADKFVHLEIGVDGTEGCLKALMQRKQEAPHVKFTLAVGGSPEHVARQFAHLSSDRQMRFKFAQSVQSIIDEHQLDGVEVDWEFPTDPAECENYCNLLAELRSILGWSLWISTAISADEKVLSNLDLPRISETVDFVNLMAFDFHRPGTANVTKSGHHAQLYVRDPGDENVLSGDRAVQYLLDRGVPARKIMLGVPLYSHCFHGSCEPNQPYPGPTTGSLPRTKVKHLPAPGMVEVFDRGAVAAYARIPLNLPPRFGTFISYDSKDSVRVKAEYVKRRKLRGLFYWHLACDKDGEESLIGMGHSVLVGPRDLGRDNGRPIMSEVNARTASDGDDVS